MLFKKFTRSSISLQTEITCMNLTNRKVDIQNEKNNKVNRWSE